VGFFNGFYEEKEMKKTICIVALLLLITNTVNAEITINTERVHIGDQPELTERFADWGTFQGTTWQKTFNIDTTITTGELLVEAFDIEAPPDFLNSVSINGTLLGYLPYVGPPDWYSSSATLSVPQSVLHLGINTLEIASGYGQGIYNEPTYDDFGVGTVTLTYVPEPTIFLTLLLGGVSIRRKRK